MKYSPVPPQNIASLHVTTRFVHDYRDATLGVMLGLFERSNSWDVLTQPLSLVQTALGYLQTADILAFFVIFTASLYVIYYGFGAFIRLIASKR